MIFLIDIFGFSARFECKEDCCLFVVHPYAGRSLVFSFNVCNFDINFTAEGSDLLSLRKKCAASPHVSIPNKINICEELYLLDYRQFSPSKRG